MLFTSKYINSTWNYCRLHDNFLKKILFLSHVIPMIFLARLSGLKQGTREGVGVGKRNDGLRSASQNWLNAQGFWPENESLKSPLPAWADRFHFLPHSRVVKCQLFLPHGKWKYVDLFKSKRSVELGWKQLWNMNDAAFLHLFLEGQQQQKYKG